MRRILFLGHAGVGKGFFATICAERLSMVHVSMGDVIRREILKKEEERGIGEIGGKGKEGKMGENVRQGGLIDDAKCLSLLMNELKSVDTRVGLKRGGLLLDGFPRTLHQAKQLQSLLPFHAIELSLDREVAREKLLGRRECSSCGKGFNLSHVVRDNFHMPALLPSPDKCSLGPQKCRPVLVSRNDDTLEGIEKRFAAFDEHNGSICAFYESMGLLSRFNVTRGVDDTDKLMAIIASIDYHQQQQLMNRMTA